LRLLKLFLLPEQAASMAGFKSELKFVSIDISAKTLHVCSKLTISDFLASNLQKETCERSKNDNIRKLRKTHSASSRHKSYRICVLKSLSKSVSIINCAESNAAACPRLFRTLGRHRVQRGTLAKTADATKADSGRLSPSLFVYLSLSPLFLTPPFPPLRMKGGELGSLSCAVLPDSRFAFSGCPTFHPNKFF
jgi:hypothetical protein